LTVESSKKRHSDNLELSRRNNVPNGYGFWIEAPHIDLELYRLVTAVLASPALAESARNEAGGRRLESLRMMEFAEISRILVSVAAMVRNGLEAAPRTSIELQRPVGTLIRDLTRPTHERLTFQESCNKILHATFVDPETTEVEGEDIARVLQPRVNLFGAWRKQEWKAVLDIRQFVIAAVVLR
jgi:hypothetical protein